ncbi:uncharacterized protein LOC125680943 [Ostrea edulis]|uniref:uncharacterized protein LOC125680943 n=1 Tax=Ostrea edulis TaxID=37623 RepID=UPI0024AFE8D1|nr:uncharacterized protein LOC125680943 [Ostrea edulis]
MVCLVRVIPFLSESSDLELIRTLKMSYMYLTIFFCVSLSFLQVSNQKTIPIHTYDSLLSHLTNGARVTYLFNTTTCQPVSSRGSNKNLPIFGGEIKFFLTSKSSESTAGQLVFNQDNIGNDERGAISEDVLSIYIVNDTAMILYGNSGFFANNTQNIQMVICNWTSGDGKGFWVKEPLTPSKLNSYNELRTAMVSGETVRFVVTTKGCKCPPGENCGDVYVGGYVKDFKITSNGAITFSRSMTLYFPIPTSPMYYRELLIGNVQPNNTSTIQMSYLNATTWEQENGVNMACPITSPKGHADFFLDGSS